MHHSCKKLIDKTNVMRIEDVVVLVMVADAIVQN